MISITPKVYEFLFVGDDGRYTPAELVARSHDNAVEYFRKNFPEHLGSQYTVLEESWIMKLLVLTVPKIKYETKNEWSDWEIL